MMNDDVRHLEIWIWVIIRVLSFDCIDMTVELSIVTVGFRTKESLKIPERIHYLLDKPPVGTHFALCSLNRSCHWVQFSCSNNSYHSAPNDSLIPWGVHKRVKKA